MNDSKALRGALLILVALTSLVAFASSAPDSQVDPMSGGIRTVDVVSTPRGDEVRVTVDPGEGQPESSEFITSNTIDDRDPRISIDEAGRSWVVYWREGQEGGEVWMRRRGATGGWTTEILVSELGENSRHPEIVHDGAAAHVAYEIDDGEGRSVAVSSGNGPVPWPERVIVYTSYTESTHLDVRIHERRDHLWVTWVDGGYVGWSEFDYGAMGWSEADFVPHGGDPNSAVSNIAEEVLSD